jgi:glycerol-3-phosphate dehydrogenase
MLHDVIIIGGGIVGCAIARELSRFELRVALLEKEAEVGFGTSKTNSGIIHAGHHAPPSTLKGRLEWRGNQMWDQLARDLKFGFSRVGELLVALEPGDLAHLQELKEQGEAKGVTGLELWDPPRIRREEPNLSRDILKALHAPTAAVVNPYEAVFGFMECAQQNGVSLHCGCPVNALRRVDGRFTVHTPCGVFQARYVVNAAGLFAQQVAAMLGADDFRTRPRKGEEYMLDRRLQGLVTHLVFPTPRPGTKGILIIPTVDGTIMVGPTADDHDDPLDVSTTWEGARRVFDTVRRYCPAISERDAITEFAGSRAVAEGDDFVIRASPVAGFINVGGIQSPGLTASPAIAEHVRELLAEQGLALQERERWKADLEGPARFAQRTPEERRALVAADPAHARIVCRCELVNEAEVVDAIRHGARTVDGVKFRVRAGMGRCQGGFCQARVIEILARELGIPLHEVTKRGPGSELFYPRHDQPGSEP